MTAMSRANRNCGFTLVELIVVIVLASILGIFTFQYLTSGMRTFKTLSTRKVKCDDATLALGRMSREIRDAKLSTVSIADPSTLTFTRKNTDNMQDPSSVVTFTLDSASGELRRQSAAGTSVLAKNVQSFTASSAADGTISLAITFSSSSGGLQWQTVVFPRNS
ncbi:MAG: prepilin-type N-terminal cleavage/methylation domain-containing protein [Candidatus Brocadiales bacterium]